MFLNPFLLNDWKIKATLKTVFALLFVAWALVGLDALGVHLPLLRGTFGAICLLFVPGMLILRALRIHRLGSARTLIFAVGLSIAAVMFIGLFMNAIYPFAGVARPITLISSMGTISAFILVLCAVSYWKDRDFVDVTAIDPNRVLMPRVLFLFLIPFMMIIAVYAMNAYHTNVALLAALVIIGATAFWIATSARLEKEWYPVAVFGIAVAMLYFGSLNSSYVWGWDIQKELYHANLVLANGVWNVSVSGSTNSVTSVTLLAPILSLTTGVSVTWLFKIVYPLVLALVPLGLFVAFQRQTNDKIAFLSAFFVSLLFTFFGEMPALARQEIAELFLTLLLVLIVDKYQFIARKKSAYALYAIFAISLIISHYALAFIYLAYVIIAWLLLFLVDNPALRRLRRADLSRAAVSSLAPQRMLTLVFVVSYAVFAIAWYESFGTAAATSISQVNEMLRTTFAPLTIAIAIGVGALLYVSALILIYFVTARRQRQMSTNSRFFSAAPFALLAILAFTRVVFSGVSFKDLLQIGTLSPLHQIGLFMYLISVFFIVAGLGALALIRCRRRFDAEFAALALASLTIFITAALVPQLAFSINTTRLFHISTLLLAPFCVVGGVFVIWVLAQIFRRTWTANRSSFAFKLVAAFFVVLFFFSTGFVYEVTQQQSTSFILNNNVDAPRFDEQEVVGAQWLHDVRSSASVGGPLLPIYADVHRRVLFDSLDLDNPARAFLNLSYRAPSNAYVYLGTFNVKTGQLAEVRTTTVLQGMVINYANLRNTTGGRSKIFDDGGAAVYYSRTT
jgi:uncharacterized membrane protein